jgi:ribosomal protein S16
MVNPNRFYTYAYLRVDRTPYYIGKGTGNRIYKSSGRPCGRPKDKSRIIFLKQNLTEEESFKHEKYMIAVFGRIDLGTGILYNKTDGGDGCSGRICREETRIKIGISNKGRTPSEKTRNLWKKQRTGRKASDETRRKMSNTKKGKKPSKKAMENSILASKGRTVSEKTRNRMSISKSQLWKITFSSGKIIIIMGVRKWAKENGYHHSPIYQIALGKAKRHKDIVAVEKLEQGT